jgi:hypothetical protein
MQFSLTNIFKKLLEYVVSMSLLKYTLSQLDADTNQFIDYYVEVLPEEKEQVMTMAEQLMQRGMNLGPRRHS